MRGPGVVRRRGGGRRPRLFHPKGNDVIKGLGADTGISLPELSRICAGLDAEVAEFRDRALAASEPVDYRAEPEL